jgi:hypothetical protein
MNADYAITKVRWDKDRSRLITYEVWTYDRNTDKFASTAQYLNVAQIIALMNGAWRIKIFYTLPFRNGKYFWGARVVPGQYLGSPYLTTDPNNKLEDNLESLPEC